MILMYKSVMLGKIHDIDQDGFDMWGTLIENESEMPQLLKAYLLFVTDVNNRNITPPFSDEFENDDNWTIIEDNIKKPIFAPGLYPDKTIGWRWRDE